MNEQFWETVDFRQRAVEEEYSAQWSGVIPAAQLSSGQKAMIQRLVELSQLAGDWDSYGSPPPSVGATKVATEIVRSPHFDFLPTPMVAPVSGGGVQFEWEIEPRTLEIEVYDSGAVGYLKYEHNEVIEEGLLDSSLLSRLRSLVMWALSARPEEEAA
jgi:hypothetical protein